MQGGRLLELGAVEGGVGAVASHELVMGALLDDASVADDEDDVGVTDGVELRVEGAVAQELGVGAESGGSPVVEDEDEVGVSDGADALGDEDDGGVGVVLADGGAEGGVGAVVEGAGGVVEDEDGWMGGEGAGDEESLPLSAGEVGALGVDGMVVAFGGCEDEVLGLGGPGGQFEVDVVADGAGEEGVGLEDDAEVSSECGFVEGFERLAVEGDGSLVEGIEPLKELDDGGLAAAGGADDAECLSVREPE